MKVLELREIFKKQAERTTYPQTACYFSRKYENLSSQTQIMNHEPE